MTNQREQAVGLIAERLHNLLLDEVRAGVAPVALEERTAALVDQQAPALAGATRQLICQRIWQRALGAGPLEPFLRDPEVEEILVSGTRPIWIERRGQLLQSAVSFASEDDLRLTIERLLAPAGRRVDEAEPLCDARLPDGSRVNVVLPPLAVDGPALSIRRFRRRGFSAAQMVRSGSWSQQLSDLLAEAVGERRNILVCGGTGSGKTTTLAAIAGFLPRDERIVTIEDTAELRLELDHVVRLEARPATIEGRGEVTIRRLVRNALRMRPDRIIVGEVRGAEALDMLIALSTGHDGSLTTIHAGSPQEALRRLETLALMADLGLPHAAVRSQVAEAIDLVVLQVRDASGHRYVASVHEVDKAAAIGQSICAQQLYRSEGAVD